MGNGRPIFDVLARVFASRAERVSCFDRGPQAGVSPPSCMRSVIREVRSGVDRPGVLKLAERWFRVAERPLMQCPRAGRCTEEARPPLMATRCLSWLVAAISVARGRQGWAACRFDKQASGWWYRSLEPCPPAGRASCRVSWQALEDVEVELYAPATATGEGQRPSHESSRCRIGRMCAAWDRDRGASPRARGQRRAPGGAREGSASMCDPSTLRDRCSRALRRPVAFGAGRPAARACRAAWSVSAWLN